MSQTELNSQFPVGAASLNENRSTDAINLLLKRELIELTPDGYRFQVELIRRSFTQ